MKKTSSVPEAGLVVATVLHTPQKTATDILKGLTSSPAKPSWWQQKRPTACRNCHEPLRHCKQFRADCQYYYTHTLLRERELG